MKGPVLNFRFHNPNPAEETADYILRICIAADKPKLDAALKAEGEKHRLNTGGGGGLRAECF